jgi:outer membrane protein assembly factor BamD (BamD/ComL family)
MLKYFFIIIIFSIEVHAAQTLKNIEILKAILTEPNNTQIRKVQTNPNSTANTAPKRSQIKGSIPSPVTPDMTLLETGINIYNSENYSAAINIFEKIKREYPQSPYLDQAKQWLAKSHVKQSKHKEALKELLTINQQSGEYPAALYLTADIYKNLKKFKQAEEHYQKVYAQFPFHEKADNALLTLAKLQLLEKNGNNALENTIKMIKNYSDRETIDDAYYLLGKIFERDIILKDMEKARLVYKKFIYKAEKEQNPFFKDSPLINRVKKDLKYIEKYYFNGSLKTK